jgi:hypothetical protein
MEASPPRGVGLPNRPPSMLRAPCMACVAVRPLLNWLPLAGLMFFWSRCSSVTVLVSLRGGGGGGRHSQSWCMSKAWQEIGAAALKAWSHCTMTCSC